MVDEPQKYEIRSETAFDQGRITRLEVAIEYMQKHIDTIYLGDTKLYRDMRVFFGGMATLAVLAGAISYYNTTNQIKEASNDANNKIEYSITNSNERISSFINKANEELKLLTSQPVVEESIVTPLGSRNGFIRATPLIVRDITNGGKPNFVLQLQFEILIDVTGKGVGSLIGVYKRYSGNILEDFVSGQSVAYKDALEFGDDLYFPTLSVVAGFPYHLSWIEQTRRKTCQEVDDLINKLRNEKIIGDVSVAPIFTQIQHQPDKKIYHIEIGQTGSLFDCNDFN